MIWSKPLIYFLMGSSRFPMCTNHEQGIVPSQNIQLDYERFPAEVIVRSARLKRSPLKNQKQRAIPSKGTRPKNRDSETSPTTPVVPEWPEPKHTDLKEMYFSMSRHVDFLSSQAYAASSRAEVLSSQAYAATSRAEVLSSRAEVLSSRLVDQECKLTDRLVVGYYEYVYINAKTLPIDVQKVDADFIKKQKNFTSNPDKTVMDVLKQYNVFYDQKDKALVPLLGQDTSKLSSRPYQNLSIVERWFWFLHTIKSTNVNHPELKFWKRIVVLFNNHYGCDVGCLAKVVSDLKSEGNAFAHKDINENLDSDEVESVIHVRNHEYKRLKKMKNDFLDCLFLSFENKYKFLKYTTEFKYKDSNTRPIVGALHVTDLMHTATQSSIKSMRDYLADYMLGHE